MENIFEGTQEEEQEDNEIVRLKESMTFKQIADKLNKSVGSVKMAYYRVTKGNKKSNKVTQKVTESNIKGNKSNILEEIEQLKKRIIKLENRINLNSLDIDENLIKGLILNLRYVNKHLWIKDNQFNAPFGANITRLDLKIREESNTEIANIEAETPLNEQKKSI